MTSEAFRANPAPSSTAAPSEDICRGITNDLHWFELDGIIRKAFLALRTLPTKQRPLPSAHLVLDLLLQEGLLKRSLSVWFNDYEHLAGLVGSTRNEARAGLEDLRGRWIIAIEDNKPQRAFEVVLNPDPNSWADKPTPEKTAALARLRSLIRRDIDKRQAAFPFPVLEEGVSTQTRTEMLWQKFRLAELRMKNRRNAELRMKNRRSACRNLPQRSHKM